MSSLATALGFLLLIGTNTIIAVRKSRGGDAAVVVASHACLVALFYCLRRFEAAAPGSVARDRARAGAWLLTTLLTAMFSWRVAAVAPWAVAAGVWFMGASTVLGGYYALFLLPRTTGD